MMNKALAIALVGAAPFAPIPGKDGQLTPAGARLFEGTAASVTEPARPPTYPNIVLVADKDRSPPSTLEVPETNFTQVYRDVLRKGQLLARLNPTLKYETRETIRALSNADISGYVAAARKARTAGNDAEADWFQSLADRTFAARAQALQLLDGPAPSVDDIHNL